MTKIAPVVVDPKTLARAVNAAINQTKDGRGDTQEILDQVARMISGKVLDWKDLETSEQAIVSSKFGNKIHIFQSDDEDIEVRGGSQTGAKYVRQPLRLSINTCIPKDGRDFLKTAASDTRQLILNDFGVLLPEIETEEVSYSPANNGELILRLNGKGIFTDNITLRVNGKRDYTAFFAYLTRAKVQGSVPLETQSPELAKFTIYRGLCPFQGSRIYEIPPSEKSRETEQRLRELGYRSDGPRWGFAKLFYRALVPHLPDFITYDYVCDLIEGMSPGQRQALSKTYISPYDGDRIAMLQNTLKRLLDERVSIADMDAITASLFDSNLYYDKRNHTGHERSKIHEYIRYDLKKQIFSGLKTRQPNMATVEALFLADGWAKDFNGKFPKPRVEDLLQATKNAIQKYMGPLHSKDLRNVNIPIYVRDGAMRPHVRTALARSLPAVPVISSQEIPDNCFCQKIGTIEHPSTTLQKANLLAS